MIHGLEPQNTIDTSSLPLDGAVVVIDAAGVPSLVVDAVGFIVGLQEEDAASSIGLLAGGKSTSGSN